MHWPDRWDATLLYLLPLPVTIEFIVERLGGIRYHAGRQVLLTLIAAPALGRGLARYFVRPADPLVLAHGAAVRRRLPAGAVRDAPRR